MAGELDVMAAVHRSYERPFQWGEADCCLAPADVLHELRGVDPMHEFRGRYSTEAEAGALIAAFGGLEQAVAAQAPRAGFRHAEGLPQVLDFGVSRSGAVGLYVGAAWLAKTRRGMRAVRVDSAWRL